MPLPNRQVIEARFPDMSGITEIAKGGQKLVYEAQHRSYGRVVLKLIHNPNAEERTAREIEVAGRAAFPNVPIVHDSGTITDSAGETLFIVEQFIEGLTLRQHLVAVRTMPLEEVIQLMQSLLSTAVELEKQQLVHRDIKPENIMLGADGQFWLLDFGIARHLEKESLTATGQRYGPGTLGYCPLEQLRNEKDKIDSRADLFAIGVVAYEAITGINPFTAGATSPLEVLLRMENLKISPLVHIG